MSTCNQSITITATDAEQCNRKRAPPDEATVEALHERN